MIGRGLSLTHRSFNAVDLATSELDPVKTPLLWVMIEKECAASIQQKLVDYARQGGKLILAGRMCVEDFDHRPCTILKDALGIEQISGDQPFIVRDIRVFDYQDVPVSFIETYTGEFDESFAWRENGEIAGF
jgi:beta-galactosidase